MKESIFNIYAEQNQGVKLLFNSFTCALAVVDDTYIDLLSILEGLDEHNVPDHLRDCFLNAKECHFIVDDFEDEIVNLSVKRKALQYSSNDLRLTIAPTLSCNFKCIYCYEESEKGKMSRETQDAIVAYVRRQASELKRFSVTWYGGEPLLAKEVVYQLSEEFLSVCEEYNIQYDASMVTNGSLLDKETIDNLIKYKVSDIQITIDGLPETHNKRRVSKNGKDSFDVIVDNINRLLLSEEILVAIRVNLDKSNESDLEPLLDMLSKCLVNKRVYISFGQVKPYTQACGSIENVCYSNIEYAREQIKFYKLLEKYEFTESNSSFYPQQCLVYCGAEKLKNFVVDHHGNFYKCWNVIGQKDKILGNVKDVDFDETNSLCGYWLERNPIKNEKCLECKLLPVCMGGCPYNDLVKGNNNECDIVKYNINQVMLEFYEMYGK